MCRWLPWVPTTCAGPETPLQALENHPEATWKRFQLSAFSNFAPHAACWSWWVVWDPCWSPEMPLITPKGACLPQWPGSGSSYSPLSVGNMEYHQCLASCCTAHKAAKIAKETRPPHVTQKSRIEDIMPLIEKGGTQETLWYIYICIFIFFF